MLRDSICAIIVVLSFALSASVSAQNTPPKLPANAEDILLKEATASHQEELAIAKAKQNEAMDLAQHVTESLDNCASLGKVWESEIAPLLTSEDGKFLTAQPDYVKAFSGYYHVPHATQRDVDRLRESLTTLTKPLKAALGDSDSTYVPKPDFMTQLETYKDKAVFLESSYDEPIRMIKAILARAQKEGKKGTDTLSAAVDQLAADTALEKGQELAAQLKAKQEETAKRMGEAQQQTLDDRANLAEKAAKQDSKIAEAQADKEAQIKLAKSPDIQKRLAPFITPGMTQIGRNRTFRNPPNEAHPLSFSDITQVGALTPTDEGRKELVWIATYYRNDRPKWTKPVTSEEWKWVKENQDYLRNLGPILVELGMLAR
jgi:hypothetical protein